MSLPITIEVDGTISLGDLIALFEGVPTIRQFFTTIGDHERVKYHQKHRSEVQFFTFANAPFAKVSIGDAKALAAERGMFGGLQLLWAAPNRKKTYVSCG
ncbi:hypothetical protein E8E13_011624 [Curvularia kusanoi]|uniref:Uncharacterized protein n=1 Tax=Curvularia kusanoi TaxID=90978 RepID=A0A9P4TQK5_CURKU|nr:hypothetical protein E8E13_011624 [Curvularia kusanoi]